MKHTLIVVVLAACIAGSSLAASIPTSTLNHVGATSVTPKPLDAPKSDQTLPNVVGSPIPSGEDALIQKLSKREFMDDVNLYFRYQGRTIIPKNYHGRDQKYLDKALIGYFVHYRNYPEAFYYFAINENQELEESRPQMQGEDMEAYAKRLIRNLEEPFETLWRQHHRNLFQGQPSLIPPYKFYS